MLAEKEPAAASKRAKGVVAETWQSKVKKLVPLDINRFAIRGGEIHHRDFHSKPEVNVFLQSVRGDVSNLTNSKAFLRAYSNLDAESGTFSVFTEITCSKGKFKGYVKPFLEDMRVFNWQEKEEGVVRKLWEGVAPSSKRCVKVSRAK